MLSYRINGTPKGEPGENTLNLNNECASFDIAKSEKDNK
jgi:hypothetical protein